MSEQQPPGGQVPPSGQQSYADAKAQAKAAKAYAKASRPWYRKKRWWFLAVVVLIVIIAVASSNGGGDSGPQVGGGTGDTGGDGKPASQEHPVAIGQSVALAGTQYTVTRARKQASVGDQYSSQKAGGIYVVVSLKIENKKDETKTFTDEAAKLVGGNGKTYSTDTDGSIAAAGNDQPLIFEDMQPDVPKAGVLVFDVPPSATKGALLKVSDLFGAGDAYIDLGLR